MKRLSAIGVSLSALAPAVVLAQEEGVARSSAEMPALFSAGYLVQVLGSLLVVFICLFGVIFMLRRFNRLVPSAGAPLRVLGSASVGQRERIVLVEAGSEQLLVGVAPGSVRTLHVMEEPIYLTDDAKQANDFAAVLRAANPLGGRS